MNLILAAQDRKIDDLTAGTKELAARLKALEEDESGGSAVASQDGADQGGPSERPPDGRNR